MVGTLLIVIGFQSSSALGAAYGIAVTGTMAITTMLFTVVARAQWGWPLWQVVALAAFFLTFDFAFLGANALKIVHGGWVPLAIALGVFTLMTTWKRGRGILNGIMRARSLPLDLLLEDIGRKSPTRVPGTAVFMTSDNDGRAGRAHASPQAQQGAARAGHSPVGEHRDDARRQRRECVTVTALEHGFYRVTATFGFMEQPSVPEVLRLCAQQGLNVRLGTTSYYLGSERLIPTGTEKLARWRKKLFIVMSRNAQSATEFFQIPPNRVVELGAQIEF